MTSHAKPVSTNSAHLSEYSFEKQLGPCGPFQIYGKKNRDGG